MKLIILDGVAIAAVSDEYQLAGFEQDVIDAPEGFDPMQLSSYLYLGTTLEEAKAALMAQIEPQRIAVMNAGLAYQFPDGPGVIQTRNPMEFPDQVNLNGIASMALIAQAAGASLIPNGFKDAANVVHPLSPAQAIAMTSAAGTFVSNLIFYKSSMQAKIAALATFEDAQAFDITAGWPTQ